MLIDAERWRDVMWAPKYQVSDRGRVRREINRCSSHKHRNRPWSYLKPYVDKDGYHRFTLAVGGEVIRRLAHRLVYEVWVGELTDGLVVAHKDGSRTNNTPSNLVQTTQHQNIQHKRLHGTWQTGDARPRVKYTDAQVLEVMRELQHAEYYPSGRLVRGEAQRIADALGVPMMFVSEVKTGKSRSNVRC
jgi:hypothetical protein